jgi:hypothetical protein
MKILFRKTATICATHKSFPKIDITKAVKQLKSGGLFSNFQSLEKKTKLLL